MELRDVKNYDDFEAVYAEKQLKTTSQKIRFLEDTMGIKCSHYEVPPTEDQIHRSLQEHALYGWPKGQVE
jgi:hypothetical protein